MEIRIGKRNFKIANNAQISSVQIFYNQLGVPIQLTINSWNAKAWFVFYSGLEIGKMPDGVCEIFKKGKFNKFLRNLFRAGETK